MMDSKEKQLRDEIAELRARLNDAQATLEFRDERRRDLSRMLNLGVWEWDEIANKPLSYSNEMAEIFGIDVAEMNTQFRNHKDLEQMVHPDDRAYFREHLDDKLILKPGVSHVFDYRIVTRKGETRRLREYEQGVFNDQGLLIARFGLVQDITDSQSVLVALKESEERYSSLFEQMPLGVQEEDYTAIKGVVDKLIFQGVDDLEEYFLENPKILREMVAQTRIISVNEALIRLHKADSKEVFLAGEGDFNNWWDAQWVEYYSAEIAGLASDRHYYAAERVDSQCDGSYFETRSIATLVRGYEDSWERVITIHEDITDRKRSEAELIEAKTQAEKANQAKSEFLSSMSHELRTPLNAILGFSQLSAYDRDLGEQHRANAIEINRAGRHLKSLIDEILDLSRIEAGENDVLLQPVALQPVLSDSVNWVTPLAHNRGIDIGFDGSDFDGLNVEVDIIRLKQVFLNLLTNAIKYNRDGGKVDVLLEHQADDWLRIGIRDTGSGISDEKLKELFQPFNRLGAEFSSVEGTGIGLVITRQLLDLMHGELEIDSKPDAGSTFWVRLKATHSSHPLHESPPPEAPVAGTTQLRGSATRILVAEDNLVNRELMAAQLDLLGYQADYVEDGVRALDRWRQFDYGLLLTDIRMPNKNGYELVREVRRLEALGSPRAPVIAITANALAADVEKCFAAGVDDVIPKPVELHDLRDALAKWAPAEKGGIAARREPPVVAGPSTDDVIDMQVLIRSTGDKPGLHCQLLISYLDALAKDIDNIQQAFAWKNSEQVAEHAHKLKSSSSSLGANFLASICQQLEMAAGAGDWDALESLMPRLHRNADRVSRFITGFSNAGQNAVDEPPARHETVYQAPDDDDDVTQFSIKLLLLDDDYIMHRVTTVMLNDLGISSVLNAMSGSEALKILEDNGDTIDVVICDLNMPKMDGVEFIRHLARLNYQGSLILTSGEDLRILKTVEKLAIEHELHVLGVLEKPTSPAKLSELLDSVDQIRQEGTMLMAEPFNLVELEEAINTGQLDTWFQPKVDIGTGRVVGLEALVRWNHPLKGLIKPNAFVAMAEEHGLIGAMTDVVCNKALEYAVKLREMEHDLDISINISVDSLTDLDWPDHISNLLERSGLEASSITLEITESRLMENLSVALDILSRLSLKRFNLSIDDFGTGYSSMEQLQRIPFSEFKIDRAFVHGAASETSARAILESSVLLAKKLDMKVVAEGVEDQQDWDLVAEVGCDQVQGYFVTCPLPFENLVKWLDHREN